MTVAGSVTLPGELERRKIFHALKRWSSYTAWNRILAFYQAWADTSEKSLQAGSAKGCENKSRLDESHHAAILAGLAHCDDGVTRLKGGDKRVFRCDVNGDFVMASCGAYDHWWQAYIYIQTGDIAGGDNFTPYWDEFIAALVALNEAWSECSPNIIECAPDRSNATHTLMNEYLKAELAQMSFPSPLPEVPNPTNSVLVRTGHHVPWSGIWEPVEVSATKIFSLFKAPSLERPVTLRGTMAYLHGETAAPPMASYGKIQGEAATWRLLWRDDRYSDGNIPEEEKSYLFLRPKVSDVAAVVACDTASITILGSGQRTPVAGRWVLQESLSVSVTLAAGEMLPQHLGTTAQWVLADT